MPVPTPEQLDDYALAPARALAALDGLNAEQLQHAPADSWSIHQVIVHLADAEAVVYTRIRKVIAEDRPPLDAFSEEKWASNLHYQQQNHEEALALFQALRTTTVGLLRLLPDEAWDRVGLHSERGPLTLYDIFTMYLGHGITHLNQIEAIKQRL